MKNLDKALNEELNLDETVWSDIKRGVGDAVKSVGKNVKRSYDLTKGLNTRVKDAGRKVGNKVDSGLGKFNAKTDAINSKKAQAGQVLKQAKVDFMKGIKNFVLFLQGADGEDAQDKMMDTDVLAWKKYVNQQWEFLNKTDAEYTSLEEQRLNEDLKNYWVDVYNKFKSVLNDPGNENKIEALKQEYDKVAVLVNKAFKKANLELFTKKEEPKKTEKSDGDKFADKVDDKVKSSSSKSSEPIDIFNDTEAIKNHKYRGQIENFKRYFGEAKSFKEKLIREFSSDDLEGALPFVRAFYDPNDKFGEFLRQSDEKYNNIKSKLKKFRDGLDDEDKEKFDSVLPKKSSESEKPEDSNSDKAGEEGKTAKEDENGFAKEDAGKQLSKSMRQTQALNLLTTFRAADENKKEQFLKFVNRNLQSQGSPKLKTPGSIEMILKLMTSSRFSLEEEMERKSKQDVYNVIADCTKRFF